MSPSKEIPLSPTGILAASRDVGLFASAVTASTAILSDFFF